MWSNNIRLNCRWVDWQKEYFNLTHFFDILFGLRVSILIEQVLLLADFYSPKVRCQNCMESLRIAHGSEWQNNIRFRTWCTRVGSKAEFCGSGFAPFLARNISAHKEPFLSTNYVVVSVNTFEASKEQTYVREINVKVNNSSISIVAISDVLPYKLREFFISAFAVCWWPSCYHVSVWWSWEIHMHVQHRSERPFR